MGSRLKEQVAAGAGWTMGEKVATALFQFVVRILVLRLLLPEDLTVVALLLAAASVALVMVDSGFSQMLVRKSTPEAADYLGVFRFNIGSSLLLYLLLTAAAPAAARYYAMPEIAELAPIFFLMIPLNALCVIQQTICTRQFRFALLSKVVFAAQVVSGTAAVLLAYAGCGVWALVWQQVLLMGVRALLLWHFGSWSPRRVAGAWPALRQMAPYSMSLLLSDLVAALYAKVPHFILGKIYPEATLGYYDQASKLKELPVQSAMQSVQQVTFPALAKIAGDRPKFAESYRQIRMVVAYGIYPIMAGMAAVAHDLFAVLLGEQWMPTVPLFEVFCLAGLFAPSAMIAYNILKVKAEGGTIVRLEVLKKGFMTLALVVALPRSVEAVVWALVASAAFDRLVNSTVALRLAGLSWWRLERSLLPTAAVTAAMYGAVRCIPLWLPEATLGRLVVEIAVGALLYLALSALFRLEAFREVVTLLRRQLSKQA